ncbi:MAG: beta-lactamase family protein [Gemmatimonadetes bacterium]|nr:beta-lactamase family protein [Gemmatimonadota bacterium]
MRLSSPCRVLLGALLSALPLAAQTGETLPVGETRELALAAGESIEYTISLDADQFVYGEVLQIDGDLRVSVTDGEGEDVAAFDGLDRGAEPFSFTTEAGGQYQLRVESQAENGTTAGRVALLTVEAAAQDPVARLDQLMRPHSGTDRPGVVVGVVRDGSLLLTRGYGMANLDHGVAFGPNTISNIGSVTKQFTAMGLLLLEQDGKLSLDDDIRTHIPELPDWGDPITLRNLLNHTGGYREIYNLLPLTGYEGEDAFDRTRAIQVVQRQTERQAAPNTEWNYNNTGFILLSLVVERTSGMSFDEYMGSRVFEPLGMSDTRVKMVQGQIIPGSAQGYVPEAGRGYRTARDLAASAGAGGVYTTVADLARWLRNFTDPELGGAHAIRQLATSAVLADGDSTGYGLGLGVSTRRGRTLYQHTGGDVAHRAYLGYYPEFEGGVIVMSNDALFNLGMGSRIADLFFDDELEPEEAVADGGDGVAVSPERLEALAGDWVLAVGPKVTFGVEDGSLTIHVEGQGELTMVATSDSTFTVPAVGATVTFHQAADGTFTAATLDQNGELELSRAEPEGLTAEDLAAFAGRYFSEELEVYYEIRVSEGALEVHHLAMDPVTLSHRTGDDFSGSAFFLATVTFERDGTGAVTGFLVDNVRTKGVQFRKVG